MSNRESEAMPVRPAVGGWQAELAEAIRDPAELLRRLDLPRNLLDEALQPAEQFRLLVPRNYFERIEPGNPRDPLLLQVLPCREETFDVPGFTDDSLNEGEFRPVPGLLKKYRGRVLLVVTGVCAIHCRYCFRRNYPYGNEPRREEEWQPALRTIAADESIEEVLLSGGDPLTLSDRRLHVLYRALDAIGHVRRLRVHTRLPIVLPSRITDGLISMLRSTRATPIFVVHANHPREISGDCSDALRRLVRSGVTVLNQSVLLRGVNDDAGTLTELSRRLIDLGVMPYYLHQLDRVTGTAHFEVEPRHGLAIIAEMRKRLPGYAVPRYVREVPGAAHKSVVAESDDREYR